METGGGRGRNRVRKRKVTCLAGQLDRDAAERRIKRIGANDNRRVQILYKEVGSQRKASCMPHRGSCAREGGQ